MARLASLRRRAGESPSSPTADLTAVVVSAQSSVWQEWFGSKSLDLMPARVPASVDMKGAPHGLRLNCQGDPVELIPVDHLGRQVDVVGIEVVRAWIEEREAEPSDCANRFPGRAGQAAVEIVLIHGVSKSWQEMKTAAATSVEEFAAVEGW